MKAQALSDTQRWFERLTGVLRDIEHGRVVANVNSSLPPQELPSNTISPKDPPRATDPKADGSNHDEDSLVALHRSALDLVEDVSAAPSSIRRGGGDQVGDVTQDFIAQLLRVDLRVVKCERKGGRLRRPLQPSRLSLYKILADQKRKLLRRPVKTHRNRKEPDVTKTIKPHFANKKIKLSRFEDKVRFEKPLVSRQEALAMLEQIQSGKGVERVEEGVCVTKPRRLPAVLKEHDVLQKMLEAQISVYRKELPLTFLMEQNLKELGQRQGVETVMAIMRRFVNALEAQALEIWVEYVQGCRRRDETNGAYKIQAYYRGFRERKMTLRLKRVTGARVKQQLEVISHRIAVRAEASLLLQRCIRGYFVRRDAAKTRLDLKRVVYLQSLWRKKLCSMHMVVLLQYRAYKNFMATRIQRCFRGMKGRRRAAEHKVDQALLQQEQLLQSTSYVLRRKFVEVGATFVIARAWKAFFFRNTVQFRGHSLGVAIQRIVRGHLTRVKVKPLLEFAQYQSWVKTSSTKLTAKAVKIQQTFRAKQSRKRLQQLRMAAAETRRQRLEQKKVLLQSGKNKFLKALSPNKAVRVFTINQGTRDRAATKLQATWRANRARASFRRLKGMALKKKRRDSATLIQSLWRGCRVRRNLHEKHRNALRIQRFWRENRRRMSLLRSEHSFIALQACRRAAADLLELSSVKAVQNVCRLKEEAQRSIAKRIRGVRSRAQYATLLDNCRAEEESKLAGAGELQAAFLNQRDRLLLLALYTMCEFEPFQLFMERCEAREVDASWTRTKGLHIGGAAFARLCKDVGLARNGKAKTGKLQKQKLTTNDVDLAFAKASACTSKGSKSLHFAGFVRAVEILADKVYPELNLLRKLQSLDARMVLIFEEYLLGCKHLSKLNQRVGCSLDTAAKKIQCFIRMRKSRHILELSKLVDARKRQHEEEWKAAVRLQKCFRQFRARLCYFRIVRSTFVCYNDLELDLPYWMNPRTGYTTWTKPSILGTAEVDNVISVPPIRHQFVIYCERCETYGVSKYCNECEELQCKACFESFHQKGSRATHTATAIDQCVNCQFQVASRKCKGCVGDCFCDTCFEQLHKKPGLANHEVELLLPFCQICNNRAARYWEGDYQCCGYCLEASFGVSLEERSPMTLRTVAMDNAHYTQAEEEEKQQQEALALEREQARLWHLQCSAAITIQRYTRGWAVRTSSHGKLVSTAITNVRSSREESKANTLTFQSLAKGMKAISKEYAKVMGEKLISMDSKGLDIMNKLPQRKPQKPPGQLAGHIKKFSPMPAPADNKIPRTAKEKDVDHIDQAESGLVATETFETSQELPTNNHLWRERYDEESECVYYYNEETGETSWENPHLVSDGSNPEWERNYDESSGHYYLTNTVTGESVWEEVYNE